MESKVRTPNSSDEQLMHEDSDGLESGGSDGVDRNTRETFRTVTYAEWCTVAVLCYVNLINYMDRYTMAGVMSKMQDHFHISDSKAGLLQTVFVISYMIFAPIFGYLGDRYNRKAIMAFGVCLWSLTTLVGSFMDTYWSFIAFRALVGIGEASYSTIAPTIISDLFVKDLRAKMLALFYFAIPVGSGLGYIVGSETAAYAGSWQWALRVTPVMGAVAVLLLIFVVRDPKRGESESRVHLVVTSWTEDLKSLIKNRSFMLSTGGFMCVAFVTGALAWWGPEFIYRGLKLLPENSELELSEVAFTFGILTMFSGLIGVPLGNFIAVKLRKCYRRADPLVCAFGLFSCIPFFFAAMVLSKTSAVGTYTCIFLGEVALNLNCVSFAFGLIAMIAGLVGVPLGSFLSQKFRTVIQQADPLICGLGILVSTPLFCGAMILARYSQLYCYLFIFFGQLALNLNWAVVADILLYVVVPTRRSTAEAFQILISHAFGDAGSPYLIGAVADSIAKAFETNGTKPPNEISYYSLQYALFSTSFVEVLGGVFFLINAIYIVRDKLSAEKEVRAENRGVSNLISSEKGELIKLPVEIHLLTDAKYDLQRCEYKIGESNRSPSHLYADEPALQPTGGAREQRTPSQPHLHVVPLARTNEALTNKKTKKLA